MASGIVLVGLAASLLARTAAATPAFTLPRFPIGESGATAYTAPIVAALDHSGRFYTHCCDSRTIAYTGETADRADGALFCPVAAGNFPSCLLAPGCLCSYAHPDGGSFVLTGSYVGIGTTHLLYDGHAGYDYGYGFGVPIVAPRAGMLCKAQEDAVNGRFSFVSAWDKFHTFYVDHGVIDGVGYATWYLHASDLETPVLQALAPGGCAAVAEGEVVARVGNTGTGAPHLHFEVREYVPADGPEAASSRVFDPYGWQGAAFDPWEDPSENPQAVHRAEASWTDCGPSDCGPCARCDATLGCVAAIADGCRTGGDGLLVIRDREGTARDRLAWRWLRGAATAPADFGDPTSDTGYELCIFGPAPSDLPLSSALAPAASTCAQGKLCWRAKGRPPGVKGFRYRNAERTPHGLDSVVLAPGAVNRSKVLVKARGEHLSLPPLPLRLPVRVQIRGSHGVCWEGAFSASGAAVNGSELFRGTPD